MTAAAEEVGAAGDRRGARWWWGLALAIVVFGSIAPTLPWLEFFNGSEILNVTTAMEIRREGNWLVPTLQGEPRTQKPPLTAWITAASIRESTMKLMSSADAVERAAGERQLGWDARWAALVAACGTLVAVYSLGTIIGGSTLGLVSAAVCGTTLLFLRHARLATTDVHLMLWVNVANALLATAVLGGRWWSGCVLGGAALGVAFMTKGPVGLVQSVVPLALFIAWRRWGAREEGLGGRRGWLRVSAPIVVGVVLMLAIALPWFGYVLAKASDGQLGKVWLSEVSRVGATDLEPDPWFNYVAVVPYFFPWTVYLIIGLVVGGQGMWRRSSDARLLALFLFVVPILVMSFFNDRKERYLLPMLGPGAVVTAWALLAHARAWGESNREERWTSVAHWAVVVGAAIGLPLLGATGWVKGVSRAAGGAWFGWGLAVVVAFLMIAMVAGGIRYQRRSGVALVVATTLFMLVFQLVLTAGYRTSAAARSQMKPLAEAVWERAPGAPVYNAMRNKRVPGDLSIYLNQSVVEVSRAQLRRASPPYVVVMYQDADGEAPAPPGGTELVARVPRGRHWWYAYVRE
jgi:4-amino-4-deoxy-L-arabinose transferase-like glycosyltransferase